MAIIRLWRLGYIDKDNPSNSLLPTAESIRKLKDMVNNNTSGGILDIIWGPELSLDVLVHPDGDDVTDIVEQVGEEE